MNSTVVKMVAETTTAVQHLVSLNAKDFRACLAPP